jgi:hypothetical protein
LVKNSPSFSKQKVPKELSMRENIVISISLASKEKDGKNQ